MKQRGSILTDLLLALILAAGVGALWYPDIKRELACPCRQPQPTSNVK